MPSSLGESRLAVVGLALEMMEALRGSFCLPQGPLETLRVPAIPGLSVPSALCVQGRKRSQLLMEGGCKSLEEIGFRKEEGGDIFF